MHPLQAMKLVINEIQRQDNQANNNLSNNFDTTCKKLRRIYRKQTFELKQ